MYRDYRVLIGMKAGGGWFIGPICVEYSAPPYTVLGRVTKETALVPKSTVQARHAMRAWSLAGKLDRTTIRI
jgi:hypothetical protein